MVGERQHFDYGVNMPFLWGGILLTDLAYLVRKLFLEVRISSKQKIYQFFYDGLDVGSVSNLVDKIEGLFLNNQVVRSQAFDNGLFLSLNRVVVDLNYLDQLLKGNISDIVVIFFFVSRLFLKKSAQNVDSQDTQATACFNLHNSLNAFRKHWNTRLLCILRIRCNLG
jgi:hypothetical protein